MNFIPQIQSWIFLLLALAGLAANLTSFIHAAMTKPATFAAADKRTKGFWLGITGVAAALAFLSIPAPGGAQGRMLFTILALIAGGVYLTDVRPALKRYSKRPPSGPEGWRSW